MHQEDVQQQIGYTISLEGDQGTPFHLAEANIGYMVFRTEEFNLTAPKNAANHRYESYYRKFKEVADAREINTYTNPKSLAIDYRFWDGFHVAEPLELFRLKCAIDRRTTAIGLTHFKRNNPLVCRVSARCNHGSAGSK
jgi:hypothetical protein